MYRNEEKSGRELLLSVVVMFLSWWYIWPYIVWWYLWCDLMAEGGRWPFTWIMGG